MRIAIACFSERGRLLGTRLLESFRGEGDDPTLTRCGNGGPRVGEWAGGRFADSDALIVIGSAGIAVRAIAPHLSDKTRDPAVVVVDERGLHAVSLLSGHIGGANALARRVAAMLGAAPVVTTATDVSGVFAVDAWAAENGLAIANPRAIKAVSATSLEGGAVRFWSAFPVSGALPDGWVEAAGEVDVRIDVVSPASRPESELLLIPRVLALGIGCRKGTACEAIAGAFRTLCDGHSLAGEAFFGVFSIDLKKDEAGLARFCRDNALALTTYAAGELAGAEGEFSASEFVRAVTGVDTVCERAAALGSGGRLRIGKTVIGGVALAVGEAPYRIEFFPASTKETDE